MTDAKPEITRRQLLLITAAIGGVLGVAVWSDVKKFLAGAGLDFLDHGYGAGGYGTRGYGK